ncbi:hypothetical protein Aduo_004959 [Ancylostoma duodenale]
MLLLLLLFAVYFEVHESKKKEEERKRRQKEEEDVINEFMLPPIEDSSGSSSSVQQLERNRQLYQFRSLHSTELPSTPLEGGHARTPVITPAQNKEQQAKQAQPEVVVTVNHPKPEDIVFEANRTKERKAHCDGDLLFDKR